MHKGQETGSSKANSYSKLMSSGLAFASPQRETESHQRANNGKLMSTVAHRTGGKNSKARRTAGEPGSDPKGGNQVRLWRADR